MAITMRQIESLPESYPASGLSPEPDNAAAVWQRIESYISRRFTPRAVTWIVEGCGEWCPPLTPATIETVETWCSADEWETVALNASALGGLWLPATGPYRFTGIVGSASPDDAPAAVLEAFKRLSEYMAADREMAGARSENVTIGGVLTKSYDRSANWLANAMANSGAGDLLRPYRRAA